MTMPLPTALLFDMDGTIVDNMAYHTDTWLELLRERGIDTTAEEFFAKTAGMTNPQILRHYFGPSISDDEAASFGQRKEEIYRNLYRPHIRPMKGLLDLLEWARGNGIKLGLATSAPPENIEFTLAGTNLSDAFDVIVGSRDVTHGKPHPEIYLKCAEKLGVDPSTCIVFEDAPMGVEAGVRAGMSVYVVTTVLKPEEASLQRGVAGVISDFDEAMQLLR